MTAGSPIGACERTLPVMPEPEAYEMEYQYWPWGRLIDRAVQEIVARAPLGGLVVDYMCGTGFLLDQVSRVRKDLRLEGCTLEPATYVEYANRVRPTLSIVYEDALRYCPSDIPDVIVATGGLHHLLPRTQPHFLEKVRRELSGSGCFLLGEECYSGGKSRATGLIELWGTMIEYIMALSAPDELVEAATDCFANDLLERGEYKVSTTDLLQLLKAEFVIEDALQIWPEEPSDFGDHLFVCKPCADECTCAG